ncbi:GMC family oxidoreductase [Aminobacter aganoensis]|uniref:Choline dehydrogenase n=1 Tax=Aminobacter aganoensis TaxID=83264 RepID=A0A7X0KNL3_9HYPH|nr:GMC family oxidoreductase N-terminal domain-containing protein [Aminobacter aganoensis]MBB6357239.1 choline dehydrogenase [Aminobacter aganoensis]
MPEPADIIVIGAGAAGCVLAERLSSDPSLKVVLIEAGQGKSRPLHAFPMLAGHFYRRAKDNWSFHTEPQPALNGRRLFFPRGKRIGGSTIFNGMVYARGNRGDYDHWAQLGNAGWSYEDVLPYFKRNERHEGGETELHGGSGLVSVSHARPSNPLFYVFIEAVIQAGFPRIADMSSPATAGVGFYDFHIANGRRSSSATVLLEAASSRKNLRIVDCSLVTRILFRGTLAAGVEFVRDGEVSTLLARQEIVLTAGAIGTPHILLLSGIGNPEHLKAVGVAPFRDLPGVGENLTDHLDAWVRVSSRQPVSLLRELRADRIAINVARAQLFGKGPVSESPISAGGYFYSRPGLEYPDLQAFFLPVPATGAKVWYPFTAKAREIRELHGYGLRIGPVRPQSRGRVRLASPNPQEAPRIHPAYLTNAADIAPMIEGLKIARTIFSQPGFEPYRQVETAPGPDVRTDAELEAYVRETADSVFHPVGTARMGNDRMAVVDARLKVHGVGGLRVADASIMPLIPSGNTSAPTMMIAERAADFIREDRRAGRTYADAV